MNERPVDVVGKVRIQLIARSDILHIRNATPTSCSNSSAIGMRPVHHRHEQREPFSEWSAMVPNAACVVTVDRLAPPAEVISIDSDSYRPKEARKSTEALPETPEQALVLFELA
jgi:hypothetical protein